MAACVAASALPLRPAPPRAGGRVDTPTHRATRRVHARASAAEKADPAAFVCDDRGACASVDEMKEKEQNAVETRRALKEWGAVVNALAEGDQTVIFRKGGLKDGKGGFKLESRQFGLFPTVYHPKELDGTVSTEASKKFVDAKVPDMKRGEEVPISVVAEVTGAWVTHDASVLDALSDHHVWSRDVLESRLSWKPDTPITVLELRAKKLPAPRVHALLPDLEKYGGCKSWIDLPFSVPVKGEEPAPALADDAFRERQRALDRRSPRWTTRVFPSRMSAPWTCDAAARASERRGTERVVRAWEVPGSASGRWRVGGGVRFRERSERFRYSTSSSSRLSVSRR